MELIAVVWATEHFRNYIYGRYFTVILDHKALLTLLNLSPNGNKTFITRLTRWYDCLLPYGFKVEHRQGSKIGTEDYLSRFPLAAELQTSHYDENFTAAKLEMINEALKFSNQLNPRGLKMKSNLKKKTTAGGVGSCSFSNESILSNKTQDKLEYANFNRECKRSLEGVAASNRQSANQRQEICIPKEMCKSRIQRNRRCSFSAKYSYSLNQNHKTVKIMSSTNSPEKIDPKPPSTNTYTQSGKVNLNVVLNRVQNRPPSLSSHSDIEIIPPEKVVPKRNSSKKLNTVISFPHQLPGLS